MAVYGDSDRGTSDRYTSAALSGAVHAAVGAVAFGVLTPRTLLGMDLWDAHVEHTALSPSWDAATLAGMLYLAVLAGTFALVPAVLLGGALGVANGALSRRPALRTLPGALAAGVVVAVAVGLLVPPLVVGRDVLLWLRVLTGVMGGSACALHLRYLVRRAAA